MVNRLQEILRVFIDGGVTPQLFLGVSYTPADLEPTLQPLYDLLQLKAAKEAITVGPGQAYGLMGRNWTKADIGELDRQIKQLELKLARKVRGPIRSYFVVAAE